MDLQLQGHSALVTGAASGIGRAIAAGFAAEGARVALLDIDSQVHEQAEQLSRSGAIAQGFVADVADETSVRAAVELAVAFLGELEHVAHAAAIGSGKFGFPFTNLSPQDWHKTLSVNVLGMVHVAHACVDPLIARGRGTMVFLASVAGQIGSQTDPPYSASKAANINFALCLARDLAPHGIRVNTVCPGMVRTPLNRSVWQAWHDRQPEHIRLNYADWADAKVRQIVPLGIWQEPEDIADTVLFLSSARAGQITGQTVNVDGGYVMHW